MRLPVVHVRKHFTALSLIILAVLFSGCEKTEGDKEDLSENGLTSRRRPNQPPPPPPPQPFYFGTCWNPTVQGGFIAGKPASVTITLTYVNSPGGPHSGYTSPTVNGITLTAPAGTLTTCTGSIVYTATGTPVNAGLYTIPVSIGSSNPCSLYLSVLNPPASGPTVDPGPAIGSTGIVNFTYKGQSVAYKTVRAKDGKIWLQQNLGSPQVAYGSTDKASIGDYFQWGRWDDGHQAPTTNGATIVGGPSLLNPSHIAAGLPKFIKGTTTSTKWWAIGGSATDTWSGTAISSTSGKDPCAALGAGWRLPTSAEWENLALVEDLFGTISAGFSNLRLPASGYRLSYDGMVFQNGDIGYYWTKDAASNSLARVFFFDDNTYEATTRLSYRAEGYTCRCVKE